MWHEARKQERLIRGMIVDYRRRAERRKDFYEKIKAEPTQFLQLHGRECKIHLDPAIALAGEGPAIMMPWQGETTNMIDRFDVRAHLDYIPEVKNKDIPPEELEQEERQCNYERYRILAQNAFLGIGEDKFLQQLAIEEQFGVTIEEKEAHKERLHEKKGTGAAIGYNYNDPGAQSSSYNGPEAKMVDQDDSDDESDLEIIDVDLSIDVNKMEASQAHELNAVGPQFGMAGCDLFSFLTGDADDAEHQKQLLREEKEKAMFSGRKSRRERRAHRDKKLASRVVSPPSYAAPKAPSRSRSRSRSQSRSPEPETSTSIQFITSFGDDDDQPNAPPKPLYADKVKQNLKKKELLYSDVARLAKSRSPKSGGKYRQMGPHRPTSASRSRSRSGSKCHSLSRSRSKPRIWKKTRSKSRSYSQSRSISSKSRSRSKSYSPRRRSISRSRSKSRSNHYGNKRSGSPQNNSSKGAKHNDSRSMLHESNDKSGGNKVIPRYYGRRKEDKSSSELSLDSDSSETSDEEKNKTAVSNKLNTNQNQLRLSGSSSKGPSRETLTLKEKLKRKMQAQITKQLRADKKAEAERLERESRRQARRDEEMRELAIKLRRKQREMRHQQYRRSSEDDSDRSRSGSSPRESQLKKRELSRSKSKSPEPTRQPKSPTRERRQDLTVRPKNSDGDSYPRKRTDNLEHYSERKIDEDRGFHRYERHSKHERYERSERDYGDRYDGRTERDHGDRFEQQNRWEFQQTFSSRGQRGRPFGYRGGFREQSRHGYDQNYGDGPSSWSSRRDFRGNYDRESPEEHSRGKVKLVDY